MTWLQHRQMMLLNYDVVPLCNTHAQLIIHGIDTATTSTSYKIFFVPFEYRDEEKTKNHILDICLILSILPTMGTNHTLMKI